MERSEIEDRIVGIVLYMANKMQSAGDDFFKEITMKQFILLKVISSIQNNNINVNYISSLIGSTRQNVKKMIDILEKKNFLMVNKSPYDARSYIISLTSKAVTFLDNSNLASSNERSKVFEELSMDELIIMYDQIDKLVKLVEQYFEKVPKYK